MNGKCGYFECKWKFELLNNLTHKVYKYFTYFIVMELYFGWWFKCNCHFQAKGQIPNLAWRALLSVSVTRPPPVLFKLRTLKPDQGLSRQTRGFQARYRLLLWTLSDFRFQILDFRFWVPDFWLQISDFRFLISDFGCQILVYRFQILNFGFQRISDFGFFRFQILDFRFWISGFVFQILDFRIWISDFGF